MLLPPSAQSLWRESYTASAYPALDQDHEVDVAVIGAGITGLTTAYLLKQAGFTVAVVEKDTIGGGTSGRTTGKVTSQHGLIYPDLHDHLGINTARLYGEANQTAVELVAAIIEKESIHCDWEDDDNYVFTCDWRQVGRFKQEANIAANIGLPASFEITTPLPFTVMAAVKFTGQGKMNTQKYLLGLAKAINGEGSYIFEHSNVNRIHDGVPAEIKTAQATVTAKHIVVATNVPTLPLVARGAYCILEYPQESYIVAGRLPADFKGMYISPDQYHYSILPIFVNNERMVLVGGESHLAGLRGNTNAKYQRLANYARDRLGVTEITHRWSDRDYLAYDNLPLVGKLYPWSKHLYVATAFRKWGLSNGTAAAIIMRDLITSQQNYWADTFKPQRLQTIAAIPRAVMQTFHQS